MPCMCGDSECPGCGVAQETLHKCVESRQSGCCLICDKPLAQIREQATLHREMDMAAIHLKNLMTAICTLNNLYGEKSIQFLMNGNTFKECQALIEHWQREQQANQEKSHHR